MVVCRLLVLVGTECYKFTNITFYFIFDFYVGPLQGASLIKLDLASDEGQIPVNVEGQMYADAKSYIMIEVTLAKPLVPRRAPEEVARR